MNSTLKLFTFIIAFLFINELSIAQNHKAKELERNIFQVISEEHPPNWNQLSKIHRRQSRD